MEEYTTNPEQFSPAPLETSARNWRKGLRPFRLFRWLLFLFLLLWFVFNWHADLPVHELALRYGCPDSQFMELDELTVHYRLTGKGEPIILLHDAYSSLNTWAEWTDSLSQNYQVISLDLPGFGLTGPHPQGSYSTFMYASFLHQFVQELKLKRFHLAGNGLGAEIAWFYATDHSDRLRKLILLDAAGFEAKSSTWLHTLARTPILNGVLTSITPKPYIRLMLEDVYADDQKVTGNLVQRHFELLLRPGNRQAFIDRAQVLENRPPANLVETIRNPTLILWGAEDKRISPEYAYLFHGKIRRSALRIYQNTGHWPQEENAGQSVKDVRAFLEGRF